MNYTFNVKYLLRFVSLALCIVALLSCGQTPIKLNKPLSMHGLAEPCWLRTPNCLAEDGYAYFVGQSGQAIANWGRPPREAFHSAQRDAEREYARFLGVDINASTFLTTLFSQDNYQIEFNESVEENVNTRVSDVVKSDQYFMSTHQTSDGQPLWLVYVLIKISHQNIAQHKIQIQQELAEKAEKQALALKNKKDEWHISLFNIDEAMWVLVNGQKVNQCDFAETCDINITPHLALKTNLVRIEVHNKLVWWTYGYEVRRNGEALYKGKCGIVWLLPCSGNETGMVHSFEFEIPPINQT